MVTKRVVPNPILRLAGREYDLRGIVVHGLGSTADAGHYIAFARHDVDGGSWWKYDDAIRRRASNEELETSEAWRSYYLLYQRREVG